MNALDEIDHVAVVVADLKQASHWYQTSFACELISEGKTETVLRFRNLKISLVLPSQQKAHVAYLRSDAATFGELRPKSDGSLSTFVSDPTGNIVEIVQAKDPQ